MPTINELRYNPLLGRWIIIAAERERRPWRPNTCPFCPGSEEIGHEADVVTLPNKYPALTINPKTSRKSMDILRVKEGYGYCKVVVETSLHEGDLCDIGLDNVIKYLKELIRQHKEISSDPKIKYIFPFRNKGSEIGVSLHHPHSQIYAFPFIPLRIEREIECMRNFWKERKRCLLCHIIDLELKLDERVIYHGDNFIALVPFYAEWPYEVHIYPKRHVKYLMELREDEIRELSKLLQLVTRAYNKLFDRPFPYILSYHQAPVNSGDYPFYHMHLEFYPPLRSRDKLKYTAGVERGTWTFTYDGLPEERALELKRVIEEEK